MTLSFINLAKKHRFLTVFLCLALALSVFAGYRVLSRPLWIPSQNQGNAIDFLFPDFLLKTEHLSELPKDVAGASFLSKLIDESLVFYYEEDDARLSVEGALRRLAYEHDLSLSDRFLSELLGAPALVAFWKSGKGLPGNFVLKMERGALASVSETIAKIAATDTQLQKIGTFTLGGNQVTMHTLYYGKGRRLAFLGHKAHWVFISDPETLFLTENELKPDAKTMLTALLEDKNPWETTLITHERAKHSVMVGQNALTVNYGHFLPDLLGARFDFEAKEGWQFSLQMAPSKGAFFSAAPQTALWSSLPREAAFCSLLPVDWARANAPLAALLEEKEDVSRFVSGLEAASALCWYPTARIFSPLFVARTKTAFSDEDRALFEKMAAKAFRVPLEKQEQLYTASLPSLHGKVIDKTKPNERAFSPTLYQKDAFLFFSPDVDVVSFAQKVQEKRAPALADETRFQAPVLAFLSPHFLATLIEAQMEEVLPKRDESLFHEVARTRFYPRLRAWGQKHPDVFLTLSDQDDKGFMTVDFRPVVKK